MNKRKTISGFIEKLKKDGLVSCARELRSIVAASERQQSAEMILCMNDIEILVKVIKYICLPGFDKKNLAREIRLKLSDFNIHNLHKTEEPWVSLRYVREKFNDLLKNPYFWKHCRSQFEDDPDVPVFDNELKLKTSLKKLKVNLFYDQKNRLKVNIQGRVL